MTIIFEYRFLLKERVYWMYTTDEKINIEKDDADYFLNVSKIKQFDRTYYKNNTHTVIWQ